MGVKEYLGYSWVLETNLERSIMTLLEAHALALDVVDKLLPNIPRSEDQVSETEALNMSDLTLCTEIQKTINDIRNYPNVTVVKEMLRRYIYFGHDLEWIISYVILHR